MPSLRRAQIVLIEDSEDDSFFFHWTISKSGIACDIVHFADGGRALEYFKAVAAGTEPRPDVVFVDLKLPIVSGFELLRWAADHVQPPLHIEVLSGSEHALDLGRARTMGAAGYHVKPLSAANLRAALQRTSVAEAAPAGC